MVCRSVPFILTILFIVSKMPLSASLSFCLFSVSSVPSVVKFRKLFHTVHAPNKTLDTTRTDAYPIRMRTRFVPHRSVKIVSWFTT
jgi:hypothetical protein